MDHFNHLALYNLKVVLKETGLKAELLRAWERRYAIPKPLRTQGGHRLYSEYDIAVIRWLQARQMEGLSISRAVDLFKEELDSGKDPFVKDFLHHEPEAKPNYSETQIEKLREEWIKACMVFDNSGAETIISRVFSLYPLENACFDFLQKALHEIGELWYQGKVSVQQEHFASNLATQHLMTLIALTPNSHSETTILLGAPIGEWHTFPLLILHLLLRRRGLNVVYLGENTPLEQIEQVVKEIEPSMVIMAAQQLISAATLRSAAILFQKMNIPLYYGGRIFNRIPQLRESIPADYLGDQLEFATSKIEQVISSPKVKSSSFEEDLGYQRVIEIFQSKLPAIEAAINKKFTPGDLKDDYYKDVNRFLSSGLVAAMTLGNIAFLEPDLTWIHKLVNDRGISQTELKSYLIAYQDAVKKEMMGDGMVITQWISSYLENL